jgi:hypothetical protein
VIGEKGIYANFTGNLSRVFERRSLEFSGSEMDDYSDDDGDEESESSGDEESSSFHCVKGFLLLAL